ncbi:MAG: T9SS type A sorting domain-containing protein [Bacteroidia bacterium]
MKEKTPTQNVSLLKPIAGKHVLLSLFSVFVFGILSSFAQAPAAPVATAATNVTGTSFNANWGASVGATMYFLDISTDVAFGSYVSVYNNLNVGNVTTYNAAGLTTSTTCYYYRVRAYDGAGGISLNSNTISVGSCGSTGIYEGAGLLEMKVYPNPVKDKLFVRINVTNDVSVSISDMLGKVVKTIPANELVSGIDVGALENGIYFVKVKRAGNELVQKIIINK